MRKILVCLWALFGMSAAVAAYAADAPQVPSQPQMILFRYATYIDAFGGPSVPDVDVTVEILDGEGWITSVVPTSTAPQVPRRAFVINARGKFLMPGLMDVHTHQRGDEAALAGYLYSGVTTVADLGNTPEVILPLRAAERAGRILSPRIFAAGNLIAAPNGKSADLGLAVRDITRDRAVLQKHLDEQHPDFAKLVYDESGWNDPSRPGTPPVAMLPGPVLRDVAAFYKSHELRTMAHVVHERRAVEAIGVDALAHPVMEARVSEAFVARMAAAKMPMATTLTIADSYDRLVNHPAFLDRPDYTAVLSADERRTLRTATRDSFKTTHAAQAQRRTRSVPVMKENIRRIVAAGGVAALGTDQSNGAAVHREMELLADAGLTPAQIVTIATVAAARYLGKLDELGSVEAGKRADLLLLNANPLAEIANLGDIALVMKDGRIIDEAKLPLAGGPRPARYTNSPDPHSR